MCRYLLPVERAEALAVVQFVARTAVLSLLVE